MIPCTQSSRAATAAGLVIALLVLGPSMAAAQAAQGAALKELFGAYEYYEDSPETQNGISTLLSLGPTELEFVRAKTRDPAAFVLLARVDSEHWMGLERSKGVQLLRIRDAANEYNGRLAVDMASGRLAVLRGVDYKPFNQTEDAAVAAYLAIGYLRRAMAGGEVFPATLRVPSADLAALGLAPSGAGASAQAAAAAPMAGAGEGGYLRLWSTAGVAAAELFAADKFGIDSVLESGDFAQATLSYTDTEGAQELTGKELELRIFGRVRAPENPLRVEELEGMLSTLASRAGGVDVMIHSMRTIFYVPSRPPAPASGSAAGSRDPAIQVFEYLQALGLLAGDYSVVPEAVMVAPGLTQQDLELYWWARMQRAGTPAALYPPLVDSGGKLPWGDFALFATVGLRRAGIPSMVVLIRRPGKNGVPYHAVCLYQVGKGWRWMDSGRFGDLNADDWQLLPARIYGKDVTFRVVDVAREWLRSTVDESSGWLVSRAGAQ